jgi:predicted anti-sigma-YlaC factor YlaD
MNMTHLSEHELAQAGDDSLAPAARRDVDAHLAACADCRAHYTAQRDARALLRARPILPVRDLSAAVRRTLEAERPWIDRLNINWRVWSLRAAPIAALLVVLAVAAVRKADTAAQASTDTATVATVTKATDPSASVASALWIGDVSDDTLLSLFLRANPDDALSSYVPATAGTKGK